MKLKRALALGLAVLMIVAASVAGTVAWLQVQTGDVTNTFTVGNIAIDLKEHELDSTKNVLETTEVNSEDEYKIIPGNTQPKDPFVRVEAGSEACWVFVKVEEVNNASAYISYSIDSSVWTALEGHSGVYFKKQTAVATGGEDEKLNILTNKEVSYPRTLTKTDIDKLYTITTDTDGNVTMTVKDKAQLPQLKFTAYAIQQDSFSTAAAAWAEISGS